MSDKFDYRPGLVFWSPFSAYQYFVRALVRQYSPDGLVVINEIPELTAEFGIHGDEYTYTDPDGNTQTAADIRGHFFDLDQQAEAKGWTDDDRALVARTLLRNAEKNRGQYQLYSAAAAAKPWPTYDETHHNAIPQIAAATGTAAQVLVYERQNKNRQSVIDKIEEELQKAQVADDLVAA